MVDAPTTLGALTRAQALARGAHPLLVCDAERLSYTEADERSSALARGLLAWGAGKGTHVGILAPNGVDFVVATLAAGRIGAVVVPFTTFATARELHDQLLDADVTIMLSAKQFRSHDYVARLSEAVGAPVGGSTQLMSPALPQLRHVSVDLAELSRAGDAIGTDVLAACEADVSDADPLAIIYTSGSTSAPKGAIHTHGSLLTHQRNLNDVRGLTADDRLFCNSPFCWVGGFGFGLLATIVAGATLICSVTADASATLDLLEAQRPTTCNGFAAAVAALTRDPSFADRDLSSMRRGNLYAIMPSDTRPADPALRHNMLGMTEAGGTFLLSADETDQPETRRGSFGKPAPGVEAALVDPDTGARGDTGELHLRGPFLMQRYHRRAVEECFTPDGWFATGDLARVDADGYFYYLGRRGTLIKTAGANVSPLEVEQAIARISGAVAHVIGLPDPERGESVAAVVVTDGQPFDEAALRAGLARELSSYKVPRRIVALSAARLPHLSSGKVDRRALPGLFDV
jgi:acyl-CoA synthetase (AMP-forming)/AMP-acid ligase II